MITLFGGSADLRQSSFSGGTSVLVENLSATPTGLQLSNLVSYIRGSDWGGGIGGILYSAHRSSGVESRHYTHFNGRGDVVMQTDQTGGVTYEAAYEAGGKRVRESGANPDPQRANTKDEDRTGYLNEGMRYRDLETGVWLTRDPAGFVDGPNLYAYVRQNPWSGFDPEGLNAFLMGSFVADPTTFNQREALRAEGMKAGAPVMVPIIIATVCAPGVGTAVAATGLSGTSATVATGVGTAVISDAAGQGVEMSLGQRKDYDGSRTAVAAFAGGGLSYIFQQAGKAAFALRAGLTGEAESAKAAVTSIGPSVLPPNQGSVVAKGVDTGLGPHAPGGVPDAWSVVKGGTKPPPAHGEVFSAAFGRTVKEAGAGVPHGQIQPTTAAQIRAKGGSVEVAPEMTGNVMNYQHANVVEGGAPPVFTSPVPNQTPKSNRIGGPDYGK